MTETNAVQPSEIDPICGMKVNSATAKHVTAHDGQNFYFCSTSCREKFLAAPQNYAGPAGSVTPSLRPNPSPSQFVSPAGIAAAPMPTRKPSAAAPAYVCPMCPAVREPKPG